MPSEHEKRRRAWLGCSVPHVIRCWVSIIKDASSASLNTYNTWFSLNIHRDCNPWSVFKDAQSRIYFSEWSSMSLIIYIPNVIYMVYKLIPLKFLANSYFLKIKFPGDEFALGWYNARFEVRFFWGGSMDYNHIACTSKCAAYDLNYHIIITNSKCAIHDSIEKKLSH